MSEKLKVKVTVLEEHSVDREKCTAFSMDGKYFAIGSANGCIQIYDAVTCEKIHQIQANTFQVSSLSFSVDGKYLASGAHDGYVRLWDTVTFEELLAFDDGQLYDILDLNSDRVHHVSFSLNGKYLTTQFNGKRVRIRDAITFQNIHYLPDASGIEHFEFSSDGKHLVVGCGMWGYDEMIQEFDLHTFQNISNKSKCYTFRLRYEGDLHTFALSHDGKYLAIAASKDYVMVHDANTYELLVKMEFSASQMTFSRDDKYFAMIAPRLGIIIYDTKTFHFKELIKFDRSIHSLTFSMDSKYMIVNSKSKSYKVDMIY